MVSQIYFDVFVPFLYAFATVLFILIPSNYQPILGFFCPLLREIVLKILNFITYRAGGGRRTKMSKYFINKHLVLGPIWPYHVIKKFNFSMLIDSDLKCIRQKFYKFFIKKVKKNNLFFTCILINYVPHEITKEFWKGSHLKKRKLISFWSVKIDIGDIHAWFAIEILISGSKNCLLYMLWPQNVIKNHLDQGRASGMEWTLTLIFWKSETSRDNKKKF